jgi:hypothetical protein
MSLDASCAQPKAISAGFECNDHALDLTAGVDRLLLPPVQ